MKKFLVKSVNVIAVLLLVAGFVYINYCSKQEQKRKITSGTFAIKYGVVICGYHYIDQCGVHLTKCSDEKEYHCLTDVMMDLDVKDEIEVKLNKHIKEYKK